MWDWLFGSSTTPTQTQKYIILGGLAFAAYYAFK